MVNMEVKKMNNPNSKMEKLRNILFNGFEQLNTTDAMRVDLWHGTGNRETLGGESSQVIQVNNSEDIITTLITISKSSDVWDKMFRDYIRREMERDIEVMDFDNVGLYITPKDILELLEDSNDERFDLIVAHYGIQLEFDIVKSLVDSGEWGICGDGYQVDVSLKHRRRYLELIWMTG